MRTGAILLSLVMAVTLSTNAFAMKRHHHHRHHHHHHHMIPTERQMKWHAAAAVFSLGLPIPFTILATRAADNAAKVVLRHRAHHRH